MILIRSVSIVCVLSFLVIQDSCFAMIHENKSYDQKLTELHSIADHYTNFLKQFGKKEAGDLIPGGHGLRKLRWAIEDQARGKRGGARVIYHYKVGKYIFFVAIFKKSSKSDLTPEQLKELVKVVKGHRK